MFVLHPLATTQISWEAFQRISFSILRRSVTSPLDARKITQRGIAESIVAYGEFQVEGSDYRKTLLDPGSLLKHFSISFLAASSSLEEVYEICFEGDLNVLMCESDTPTCIITATLEQWRTTLINFTSGRSTSKQRQFATAALDVFDRLGLGILWENYTRAQSNQGLFLKEK
jgi:hypothetical protein